MRTHDDSPDGGSGIMNIHIMTYSRENGDGRTEYQYYRTAINKRNLIY